MHQQPKSEWGLFAARRKHEDGKAIQFIVTANLLADFEAGKFREHEIENEQVRRRFLKVRETQDAIAARNNLEAVFLEVVTNQLDDIFIVFDDEDSRPRIHGSVSIAEGMGISKKRGASLQFIHKAVRSLPRLPQTATETGAPRDRFATAFISVSAQKSALNKRRFKIPGGATPGSDSASPGPERPADREGWMGSACPGEAADCRDRPTGACVSDRCRAGAGRDQAA